MWTIVMVLGLLIGVVVLMFLVFWMRVRWGLGLKESLAVIEGDHYQFSSNLGRYAHNKVPPRYHLKGEKSEIYYWHTHHKDNVMRESLRIEAKGFLGGLDIFYSDGQAERIIGPSVLFDRLSQGDEFYEARVVTLLEKVRAMVKG